MKQVWSMQYGNNPKNGVHKWLERTVKGYKRGSCDKWLKGFAKYLDENSTETDNIELACKNFKKFKEFIKNKKYV